MHRNNAIKQWCIIVIISMYDVCSYLLNTLCVINLLCILQLLQSVTVVNGDIHWWCMLSIHNASCTFYHFKMHADIANDWYCYDSYDVYSTSMNMLSINHAHLHDIDHSCMHACCLVKMLSIYNNDTVHMIYVLQIWACYRLIMLILAWHWTLMHLCMLSINVYPPYIINRCMSSIYAASCSYYPMYATYVIDSTAFKAY
jgi:hypothetical protein